MVYYLSESKKYKEEVSKFVEDMQDMTTREETTAPVQNNGENEVPEVSEITYSFALNSAPPGFTSEAVENNDLHLDLPKDDDDEEEFTEVTEIVYTLESSSGPGSPRMIPDLDTPKEHSRSSSKDRESRESTPRQNTVSVKPVPIVEGVTVTVKTISPREDIVVARAEPQMIVDEVLPPPRKEKKVEKDPPQPKPKIEFEFSLDDLDNIDYFSAGEKIPPKPEPVVVIRRKSTPPPQEVVDYSIDQLPENSEVIVDNSFDNVTYFNEENDGFSNPVIDLSAIVAEEESKDRDLEAKTAKVRVNELSFTPSSEGEQEHMMEDKSISMINLPAMRTRVRSSDEEPELESSPRNVFSDNQDIEPENVTSNLTAASHTVTVNNLVIEPKQEPSETSGQSQQLQDQLVMWQAQLEQNQKLLSSSENLAPDDSSAQLQQQLKVQLEMQQRMMQQMQQSMENLNIQQKQTSSSLQSEPALQMEEVPKVESVPNPPPAPVLKVQQNGKVNTGVKSSTNEKAGPVAPVKTKGKGRRIIEPPKLDPREELMIAIRNRGGMSALKKVNIQNGQFCTHSATKMLKICPFVVGQTKTVNNIATPYLYIHVHLFHCYRKSIKIIMTESRNMRILIAIEYINIRK